MNLQEISDDDVKNMSLDRLAMLALKYISTSEGYQLGNILPELNARVETVTNSKVREDLTQRWIAESLNWLLRSGLICRYKPSDGGSSHGVNSIFVTRAGTAALANSEAGLRLIAAERLLGDRLHNLLQNSRSAFIVGQFRDAVLRAMVTVEERVRDLAQLPTTDLGGIKLVNEAFGGNGPLTDPEHSKGKADGVRDLFKGSFGMYRNDSAHGRDDEAFQDPAEVAEIILLANLMHRHLDRVERRLGASGSGGQQADDA